MGMLSNMKIEETPLTRYLIKKYVTPVSAPDTHFIICMYDLTFIFCKNPKLDIGFRLNAPLY